MESKSCVNCFFCYRNNSNLLCWYGNEIDEECNDVPITKEQIENGCKNWKEQPAKIEDNI